MLPQNHRELLRKIAILQSLCVDTYTASSLTYTILHDWLNPIYPLLALNHEFPELSFDSRVIEFVHELRKLSFVDAAFWLSCGYANWVGKASRKEKAMFFTPPKLAEKVIDVLIKDGASLKSHVWFDPACGGAAFIVPIAQRMRNCLINSGFSPDGIINNLEKNVVGLDLDETLQHLTATYLKVILYAEIEKSGRKFNPNIRQTNTLLLEKNNFPKFDVLVCNPPYRKLVLSDRKNISCEYLHEAQGQYNLYAVFMAAVTKAAYDKSYIALLTPTSYMSGLHFSKLRNLLSNNLEVSRLQLLSDRDTTFVEVEQETVILYGKKTVSRVGSNKTAVSILAAENEVLVGIVELNDDGQVWYVPRNIQEYQAYKTMAKAPFRLQDYGYVAKIGPLVWNRDERKQLFSDADLREAQSPVPVIWSSNITPDGRFEFGKTSGQKGHFNFVDFENKKNDGLLRESCVVMQRVTSAEQNRRLVATYIPDDFIKTHKHFIAENHVITIIPILPKISLREMKELLMSMQVDLLYRCLSGNVGISVYELKQLPLPDPNELISALKAGIKMADAVFIAYQKTIERTELDNGKKSKQSRY